MSGSSSQTCDVEFSFHDRTLQETIANAGGELRSALEEMLQDLSRVGANEQRSIQNALNLSQSATSRLMSSARCPDPLATLVRAPGPEGLRKMLHGASEAGVAPACLDRVGNAIARVEELIDRDIGDRYSLDAMLSDWVRDSRASFESRQRAAAYKAMSALRGVQVKSFVSSWVIHPSEDADRFDAVQIDALLGCRRIRPNAVMHTMSQRLADESRKLRVLGIDGQLAASSRDIIVRDFSTLNEARMQTQRDNGETRTLVHGLPIGNQPGDDIVSAMFYPGLYPANRTVGNKPTTGVAANIEPPMQMLVLDVLLHEDVWPSIKPELRVFDTVLRGLAHPDDPARQVDQFEAFESVCYLGKGVGAFRVEEMSRYPDLLELVCDRRGWDQRKLRGYRVKMKYPVYGSQVCLAFAIPPVEDPSVR